MNLEKYRPKTLEDFIGNYTAVRLAVAFMEGKTDYDSMIFAGQPGTGKTTLAHILARGYGYQPLEQNASSERRTGDVRSLLGDLQTESIDGMEPFLIMDEAERLPGGSLDILLKREEPKVFIVNQLSQIRKDRRDQCHQVWFNQPKVEHYQTALSRMGSEVPDEIIEQFQSWRDMHNYLQGGEPRGSVIMSDYQEAKQIFKEGWSETDKPSLASRRKRPATKDHYFVPDGPTTLLEYYLYNSGDPEITSKLDLRINTGAIGRRVGVDILMTQRLRQVKKPYFHFKKKESKYSRDRVEVKIKSFIPL